MKIRHLLLSAAVACGLNASPVVRAGDVPHLTAPRSDSPRLDGVWGTGEWSGAAIALLSAEDRSEKPEVRVIETEEGLYVGILMKDNTPVFGLSPKSESLHREDVFEIFFEIQGNVRRYAEFQISRSGDVFYKSYNMKAEPEVTSSGRLTPEYLARHWTETVKSAPRGIRWAAASSKGRWVAEVFLPRRMVGSIARVNFAIHDWNRALGTAGRTGKFYYWSPVQSGCPHISPSRFGIVDLRS